MRPEEQTSRHLLLAVIITVLSGILNFIRRIPEAAVLREGSALVSPLRRDF